ncbi:hypothetical protein AJ79_10079 [Helicocarpus griseus UAMH5409]|uniref:Uncharacterized protein n=1 Tax=Helicocarpus griseus UAMH5409 TaxID=1447875 RepID=A0A2B7WFE1_9EURO|nr:hypothetical protein AJ79_10079 [Helicocarpus griseus UAMH5409]
MPRSSYIQYLRKIPDGQLESEVRDVEDKLSVIDKEMTRRSTTSRPSKSSRTKSTIDGPFEYRSGPVVMSERERQHDYAPGSKPPNPTPIAVSGPYYGPHGGPLRQAHVPPYAFGNPYEGSLVDQMLARWTLVYSGDMAAREKFAKPPPPPMPDSRLLL